jgi:ABC-type multidrug transport system ATPase subunit
VVEQQNIEIRCSHTRERVQIKLTQGKRYILGSSDKNEIVLNGQDVLSKHGCFQLLPDGLQVEPIDKALISVNGTPCNVPVLLDDGDWLSLGSSLFQINIPDHPSIQSPTTNQFQQKTDFLTIGRSPECDLVIPSPLVSREHAKLYCDPAGVEIEDLHSTNGTFVNGKRLQGKIRLQQTDIVSIAAFIYEFTGESLEPIDTSGGVSIEVRGLIKEVTDRSSKQTRRLLDDISLVIEPGEFVAIFGTSGSGKSTLLDALNGRRPATGGKVLYNGSDLYSSFDSFRASIGYVPQQDIVHRKISIKNALRYTAHLRLPPDTSKEEIETYIDNVLQKVELTEKATLPIDTPAPLSGGQLKRVSLAVELVSNPNILFLDEVTSGLDAGTDKRMMHLFADLAADRKTVICVTHTLENIDVCHQIILLHKGRLVYFGPPKEATAYFGVQRLSDVYELLEASADGFWAGKFLSSDYYKKYVSGRLSQRDTEMCNSGARTSLFSPKSHHGWFDYRQNVTLMRRYVDLIFSDKKNLLILLLQAPLIAVVIGLVFSTDGIPAVRAAAESQISFILILSTIWFGTLNSARELVKELPIYQRERSVNLGIAPYLCSKLMPLAVLCLIQCISLLGIVLLMLDFPGDFLQRLAALFSTGMAATCMGLAVSAFVDSNDKAVAMAPILLIPQVVLANAVVKLGDGGLWVAKSSIISFWALDAIKTTFSDQSRAARDLTGHLVVPITGEFKTDIAMVTVFACVFLAIAVLGLKLKDKQK